MKRIVIVTMVLMLLVLVTLTAVQASSNRPISSGKILWSITLPSSESVTVSFATRGVYYYVILTYMNADGETYEDTSLISSDSTPTEFAVSGCSHYVTVISSIDDTLYHQQFEIPGSIPCQSSSSFIPIITRMP